MDSKGGRENSWDESGVMGSFFFLSLRNVQIISKQIHDCDSKINIVPVSKEAQAQLEPSYRAGLGFHSPSKQVNEPPKFTPTTRQSGAKQGLSLFFCVIFATAGTSCLTSPDPFSNTYQSGTSLFTFNFQGRVGLRPKCVCPQLMDPQQIRATKRVTHQRQPSWLFIEDATTALPLVATHYRDHINPSPY